MNPAATPPALYPLWARYLERHRIDGRQIDKEFVHRGFTGVTAEIEFINSIYGPNTYEIDIEVHSSATAFQRYRALESEALKSMRASLTSSPEERAGAWAEVLDDPRLPSFLKRTILRSLSNPKFDALVSRHLPELRGALAKERQKICRIYSNPPVSLHQTEMIPLRKEAFNTIMSDAYGALGFDVLKKKKGVNLYVKAITSEYSVVLEPDIVAIERKHMESPSTQELIYWPLIPSEIWCHLVPTNEQGKNQKIPLVAGLRCIASGRRERYDDTQSLELMIRANALWYEINIQPFEKDVASAD
ncbi:hypothetical protein [Lysobacter sp. Hz 25]|uniref:hypothetical protein n=1 Tax=Lysobacter sp. Hz 25 TaxID=3383698 RepID=UPI0038D38089